jgi:twinkle protein
MKYKSSNTGKIYELAMNGKRSICPECSHTRRNKSEKCTSWNGEVGYCHHCETSFYLWTERVKEYVLPEWKNKTELSDKAVKWFEGRMISQKTLNELKIYTDTEYMPQFGKEVEVICFPFFKDNTLVNIKYRGAKKSFKLYKDAELVFYNINSLKTDVIIVEGEVDVLSFYEAGIKNVISVPNGATKNLEYLDQCIKLFDEVETVYLAVDNDIKGLELRDELARRLGFDKCYIINFMDCKDANEYLIKYGAFYLNETIKNAKSYPVKGIVKAADIYEDIRELFEKGIQRGNTIAISGIDEFVTWETRRLAIATGIPGHGKSEFIDFLIARLNLLYGWKAAYFTPENYPLKFHYAKMFEKFIGDRFNRKRSNENEFEIAFEHINKNIYYILDEDDSSVDTVINSAKALVKSRGIKILVIDPYNKLEHAIKNGENETQYISRFLDKLTSFAKYNDVLVILIAHPVKMKKDSTTKAYEIPNLYDISGSAHFYNKCDYGFCIYRPMNSENTGYMNHVQVHWQKIKFKHLGEPGVSYLDYNINNGRFGLAGFYDNNNWLVNDIKIEEEQTKCPF